jgi:DNA-binding IclR family transcriptional regulator
MTAKATALRKPHPSAGRPASRYAEGSGNRTMLVGMDVLEVVARMEAPATLTGIARAASMSLTRTSRYLMSLTRRGYLRQDEETGKFDLGPAVLELGMAAMARMDAVRLTADGMRDLAAATGLVSMICVWSSSGPIVIKWEQGSAGISIHVREGTRASLVGTAAGQIFLAYLDADEIKPVLQHDIKEWNERAPGASRLSPKDAEALKKSIRQRGLVHSIGYHNPALSVLSAPVFGRNNRLSMSLSLVGIRDTFDASYSGRAALLLKTTADQLSRLLGGTP